MTAYMEWTDRNQGAVALAVMVLLALAHMVMP
jgi:hypothetical protein